MASVVLGLIAGTVSDEALAAELGDHEGAAEGAAYLAGFVIEALALQRREPVSATVDFLRRSLGDGDFGLGGVREPRGPRPGPDATAARATGQRVPPI